jgi:hypothetical protein
MMKRLGFLALSASMTAIAAVAHAEQQVRVCDFDLKGGCRSGEARVTLTDGKATGLDVVVIWCGRGGHRKSLDFSCTINASRADGESMWSEDAGATVIIGSSPFTDPAKPDRIKVTVGRELTIDLYETQSVPRCGAGAELPQTIVFPAHGKVCRVEFGER